MDSIIVETRSDYSTIDYPKRRDEYDLIQSWITENVFVSGKFIFFSNFFDIRNCQNRSTFCYSFIR